jgi:hypothetical protein
VAAPAWRGAGAACTAAPAGATTGAGSHTPAVCSRVFAMSCAVRTAHARHDVRYVA